MCGIVGHIGPNNSIAVVLEGLKRLEYRGYDSAGVCFKKELGELDLHKKMGKVDNLKEAIAPLEVESHTCIGHTRWATHGEVNDLNAHPHLSDTITIDDDRSISIVHNGIIENHNELRLEIKAAGLKFTSDTDSEVFLGLMVIELLANVSLHDAVINSFKKIRGNSAFVIIMKGSREMLSIKRGAPLVCGVNIGSGEALVSSDPYALVGTADDIIFPEDDVLCSLSVEHEGLIKFYEMDKSESKRYKLKKQEMSLEISDKGDYEHFMLKEIYEQPHLIRALSQYYTLGPGKELLASIINESPKRIHIIACGTAWHAGLVIKNFIEKIARISCVVELASEFRYRDPILFTDEVGLFISQSGETADTLAAQALCKENGLKTFAIVNVEGSTLYRECDYNLLIKAGMEIGVASTKAFTQQALTGFLMTSAMSDTLNADNIAQKFSLLADRIQDLLDNVTNIKEIAEAIYLHKGFIFTGRGREYPIAFEGALKLKEIAYVHAEGYASGELKHGPIALIDDLMVNIALISDELYEKTFSNIEEVKARRGVIVTIGPENDKNAISLSDYYIPLCLEGLEELTPLYMNVATQLLAYYMAKFKGTDIDKPRNLAKSVTVE